MGIKNAVVLLSTGTGVLRPVGTDVLVRNGINIGGEVIFAHDLGSENCKLQAIFPERNFWVYKRETAHCTGQVRAI